MPTANTDMTDDVNSPSKWEANYARGTDGWDLGGPTPAFRRLLASNQFVPGRLIALGAGRSHDAREFARHGFHVTAVDFSPYVIREMQRLNSGGLIAFRQQISELDNIRAAAVIGSDRVEDKNPPAGNDLS